MPATKSQPIKVKYGLIVQAPPKAVAEYIENIDNFPEWQSGLFEITEKKNDQEGQLTKSTKARDHRNILGKTIDASYGVVDFQQGKHVTLEMDDGGDVYWRMTFTYEPVDGGTFVTGEGGGDLGQLRIGKGAAQRGCLRMLEGDLNTLRELLEARNGG